MKIESYFALDRARQKVLSPINVLMIPTELPEEGFKYHYLYISDLNGFINEIRYALRIYASGSTKSDHRHVYTCVNCLNTFSQQKYLTSHKKYCLKNSVQTIRMPEKNSYYEFSNFTATRKGPIIGAFDFESKMTPGEGSTAKSLNVSKHEIISYCLVLISSDNEIIFRRSEHSEDNCMALFIQAIEDAQALCLLYTSDAADE